MARAGAGAAGADHHRPPSDAPARSTPQLRPYQLDGFRWLAFLWENGLGGILADDMGLGKTLQSLALICHAREANPAAPPFLIVAPTSVVSNWASEAARFAPDLRVVAIVRDRPAERVPLRRTGRGRRHRRHLVHPGPARRRRVRGAPLVEAAARRGAVRQEPPVQGVPVRPPARGADEARDHRHPDGEQPDGAVVAAVDHRPGTVPEPDPVRRATTASRSRTAATPNFWRSCAAGSSR